MRFLLKNKQFFWLVMFLVVAAFFFVTQYIGLEYNLVYLPVDDKIPFVPAFILPYIFWYVYVPAPMVYLCFVDKPGFYRQVLSMFPGMVICCIIFIVYPSRVEFRPVIEDDGFLLSLCKIIYANDKPVNVFPSLHCYEATAIHLSTFVYGPLKNKKLLRFLSAAAMVLICLSTLFIKQHSVIDLVGGCLLAALLCFAANRVLSAKTKRLGLHTTVSE